MASHKYVVPIVIYVDANHENTAVQVAAFKLRSLDPKSWAMDGSPFLIGEENSTIQSTTH